MTVSVAICLDNLTVVGHPIAMDVMEQVIDTLNVRLYIVRRLPAKFPYRWSFPCRDGTLLQIGDASARGTPPVRVEFNPSKVEKESVGLLLGMMKYARYTRIDYAVDYKLDLSVYTWEDQASRKRVTYQSGTGRLETLYLGVGSDGEKIRIYNKALEQKQEGTWWRVESQNRYGPDELDYYTGPFKDIAALARGNLALSITERAMLHYLEQFPEAWGELSKGTRSKYRKLVSTQSERLDPSPRAVFEASWGDLKGQLAEWLRLTGIGPMDRRIFYLGTKEKNKVVVI